MNKPFLITFLIVFGVHWFVNFLWNWTLITKKTHKIRTKRFVIRNFSSRVPKSINHFLRRYFKNCWINSFLISRFESLRPVFCIYQFNIEFTECGMGVSSVKFSMYRVIWFEISDRGFLYSTYLSRSFKYFYKRQFYSLVPRPFLSYESLQLAMILLISFIWEKVLIDTPYNSF